MGKRNKRKKKTAHDKAIEELEEKVKEQYQIILKNFFYPKYPFSKDPTYELDLVGFRGQDIDIYEVKTNDNDYKNAVKQLKRAREILGDCGNIRTFYVYYSTEIEKIKRVE